ncbi:MAG: hypothetical protein AB8F26_00010 [Phycisphaerales bacterium]
MATSLGSIEADAQERGFVFFDSFRIQHVMRGHVQRRTDYWQRYHSDRDLSGIGQRLQVVISDEGSTLTYATAARIEAAAVARHSILAKQTSTGWLWLPGSKPVLDQSFVRDWFETTGGPSQHKDLDFAQVAKRVCHAGGIYIRFWGAFDDREFSIGLFYRPDLTKLV